MNYAIYFGEEKTVISAKGVGIVLNEPSITAHLGGKIVGAGREALKFLDEDGAAFKPVVGNFMITSVPDATYFLTEILKTIGGITDCLVCIPSSLNPGALNDYKAVMFGAGVTSVEFIPAVIANAICNGYDIESDTRVLSTITEGDTAEMAVIERGEIVDGGTLNDLTKFDEERIALAHKHTETIVMAGDRITVAMGACELLKQEKIVRKIIKLN